VTLIKNGDAYVDTSSEEEIREKRGTVKTPGIPSEYRDRSVEENLALFEKMKEGGFKDGEAVLRAKIDMSSPNMRHPTIAPRTSGKSTLCTTSPTRCPTPSRV